MLMATWVGVNPESGDPPANIIGSHAGSCAFNQIGTSIPLNPRRTVAVTRVYAGNAASLLSNIAGKHFFGRYPQPPS